MPLWTHVSSLIPRLFEPSVSTLGSIYSHRFCERWKGRALVFWHELIYVQLYLHIRASSLPQRLIATQRHKKHLKQDKQLINDQQALFPSCQQLRETTAGSTASEEGNDVDLDSTKRSPAEEPLRCPHSDCDGRTFNRKDHLLRHYKTRVFLDTQAFGVLNTSRRAQSGL